jgi:hypothetical protein
VNDFGGPLTVDHSDYIESKGAPWTSLARHPIAGGVSHFTLLLPVDRTERATIIGRESRLDLDERDDASLSACALDDEIDVPMTTAESPLYNVPAIPDQPLLCDPLASLPKQLLCC